MQIPEWVGIIEIMVIIPILIWFIVRIKSMDAELNDNEEIIKEIRIRMRQAELDITSLQLETTGIRCSSKDFLKKSDLAIQIDAFGQSFSEHKNDLEQ